MALSIMNIFLTAQRAIVDHERLETAMDIINLFKINSASDDAAGLR